MAIGKISGPMLYSNLERQGVNLAFDSNLLYLDVTNRFVGANTATPNAELQVVGNANIASVFIYANSITSTTGVLDFGSNANITISGGEVGRVLTTDGFGTLSWELVSSLATGFGNITINQNTITTNTLDGNLELAANGTGVVTTLTYDFYAANVFTGNVTANYINGNVNAGQITSTGNITAPWFLGNVEGTTAVLAGNVTAPWFVGNVEGNINGNVVATTVDATGNVTAPYFVGNVDATTIASAGNISAPYVIANIEGNVNGNVSASSVVATGNVDAAYFNGNLRATDVVATGNVSGAYFVGNLDGITATLTGNVTAPYFVGNIEGNITGNVNATTVNATGNVSGAYFVGNLDGTTATLSGNVTAPYFVGNLDATTVAVAGNITASYVLAEIVGNVVGNVVGNLTGNVSAVTVDATGNITAPYFVGNLDGTTATLTGNVTAPYFVGNVEGNVNAVLVTAANVDANYFNGNLRGTDVIASNISSGNSYISSATVGLQDIRISGNTISSLTTDLVLSANQSDPNNIVRFDSVSAVDLPAGTTAQRPPNPNFGYMRINTELGTIEFWGGTDWIPITSGITNQVILPDGIADTYTLDQITTTAGILVNINGTIQQADVAYTIAGDQITFAEVPLTTDIIEIRYLSAGVVSAPFNGGTVNGNVIPGSNVTYSLGDSTHWWKSLYVSGSTIYIGGVPLSIVDGQLLVDNAPVSGGGGGTIYSNTNVAAYLTSQNITSANIGAFQIYANANASGQANQITGANAVVASLQANIGSFYTWANSNFGTSSYSNTNVAAYLPTYTGTLSASRAQVTSSVDFMYGGYPYMGWQLSGSEKLKLRTNIASGDYTHDAIIVDRQSLEVNVVATLTAGNIITNCGIFWANGQSLLTGIGGTYSNTNVAAYLASQNITSANIGAYQIWANANVSGLQNQITGANTNIQTTSANIGAYQIWANANVSGLQNQITGANTNIQTTSANIGAYQTFANANVAAIQANLGAYQTYANANIGVLHNGNVTTNANIGAFYTYANANLATRTTNFNTLDANVGAFETYANTKIGTNTNSNLVVVATTASTSTTTGALVVKGGAGIANDMYVGGNVSASGIGAFYAANRPAFRVYGTVSTQIVAPVTVTSGNGVVVDYNQGSYYNNATGIFTAPVSGLYHAYATLRVGSNNGLNQATIVKNNSTAGANVICFWETDTNTGTAVHFSMTGYAQLVPGDTLRLKVLTGNINLDSNDSWGVSYIG